jgi:hypothetical protein
MYQAGLMASHVLFVGGLAGGWTDDSAYSWVNLTRTNARLAAFGREDWENYRVEVNASTTGPHIGVLARFQQDPASGTFSCYRLHVNAGDQKVVLARLQGTYDAAAGTYELDSAGRSDVWECGGDACGVDFELDTHALALTCEGDWLVVEVDGIELGREQDAEEDGGLSGGKAGLYYVGADAPDFSELVIRSAPRMPVFGWQFTTSRYAGFVEHLDSFQGLAHREEVSGVNAGRLANKVNDAEAEMAAASQALTASRGQLASAGVDEVTTLRLETQDAAAVWLAAASLHYDALYVELMGDTYRPLPPVVELSQVVSGTSRHTLLLESPEPLNWPRITLTLKVLDPASGAYLPFDEILVVWSNDGARALLFPVDGASLADGAYELQLAYALDIGLEAALLRRGGSTLPEIGRLRFDLS